MLVVDLRTLNKKWVSGVRGITGEKRHHTCTFALIYLVILLTFETHLLTKTSSDRIVLCVIYFVFVSAVGIA